MKTFKATIKSENGFALPVVLLVTVVFVILLSIVFMHYTTNTRQIVRQEESMQAHYLARAGVNLAYAAIIDNSNGSSHLSSFIADTSHTISPDTIVFDEGTVEVEAWLDSGMIYIEAVATLKNSNVTSKVQLEFSNELEHTTHWTILR